MKVARVAKSHTGAAAHMDGIYRYQRFVYDVTRKHYLLGRDRALADLRPPEGGTILEVGCGTARNLVLAARRYPTARAYGLDVSRVMLDTAERSIARAGLGARIVVAQGDASRFSAERLFGVAAFDRVLVSYALSMIPPWREALEAAFVAVAPGGELHIVDFGQQARLPHWFRRGLVAWLARFSVEPRAELEGAVRDLAQRHGASLRFERPYRDYVQRAVVGKPAA